MYYVYILKCKDGTLYTGMTTDLQRRFKEHKSGRGAYYTKWKKVIKIVYSEEQPDRSSAMKRELEIKGWNRSKKLILIKSWRPSANVGSTEDRSPNVPRKKKLALIKSR